MADERVFHFFCSKSMSRHFDDFVRSPEEPEVTIRVAHGIVPWIVESRKPGPVDLTIPLRVLVKGHEHARPRSLDDEESLLVSWYGFALLVVDLNLDAWHGTRCRASLQ